MNFPSNDNNDKTVIFNVLRNFHPCKLLPAGKSRFFRNILNCWVNYIFQALYIIHFSIILRKSLLNNYSNKTGLITAKAISICGTNGDKMCKRDANNWLTRCDRSISEKIWAKWNGDIILNPSVTVVFPLWFINIHAIKQRRI